MPGLEHTGRKQDIPREEVLASLQRILHSKSFSYSPSLRNTLEFIVRNSLSSSQEPIKEYTIATEVLGRTSDFDPKIDNIVRVHMHRVREKLDEYYSTDGQLDDIRLVIPRGHYRAEFARNTAGGQQVTAALTQPVSAAQAKKTDVRWVWWLVSIALVVCTLILVASLLRRESHLPEPATALPASLSSLWQPFVLSNAPPLIVYSNPAFLMGKRGNLYRYESPRILSMPMGSGVPTLGNQEIHPAREEQRGPFYYFDAYTGSGEVVAAAGIAQFLTAHGKPFLIKRSRIVSYEDIKRQNVIFLGGIKEDQLLAKLPLAQELLFQPPPPDQYPMGSSIQDLNPPPGHPSTYRFGLDPSTGAIQIDYGLISLLPNVSADHYVLVLAGLGTLGTEAAASFATSERDMAVLERMRAPAKAPGSRFFQALLQVQVRDGVPLDAKCLLVRDLNRLMR
jgi:hypothetical protein